MKKKLFYSIVAILFLVICYAVGQIVVKPNRVTTTEESEPVCYYDFALKSAELMYDGYEETSDMPGGKTVGLVEDEVYGKWYLLTPKTSMTAGIILDDVNRYVCFDYCIHKDVADLSDGMQLNIQVVQETTDEILYDKTLVVDKEERTIAIDLSNWKNSNVYIKFKAISSTEDQSGDWMVIKNAFIDEFSEDIVIDKINDKVIFTDSNENAD